MSVVIKTSSNQLIWFDAVLSFNENNTGTVSSHPIQRGSTISDHLIRNNKQFSIQGIVSNWDFQIDRDLIALFIDGVQYAGQSVDGVVRVSSDKPSPLSKFIPESVSAFINTDAVPNIEVDEVPRQDAARAVKSYLQSIFNNTEFVSIIKLKENGEVEEVFNDLLITSCNISETPDTGDSLQVSIALEKIKIVDTQTVYVGRVVAKVVAIGDGTGSVSSTDKEAKPGCADKANEIPESTLLYDATIGLYKGVIGKSGAEVVKDRVVGAGC